MTCIIIEDQPPAQRILQKYIADYGSLVLEGTFTDGLQAMEYLRANAVDLLFLDIHLPKLSGIDFLKTLTNPPAVILTTAFPDFALESYDLDVVDYLLKPFSFPRFVKAVGKVARPQRSGGTPTPIEEATIFIKSGFEYHKVLINQLICIHSDKDYTEVHTAEQKFLSNESLKHWESTLAAHDFIRIHKSYLVSKRHIVSISATQVEVTALGKLPIGRAFKDNVQQLISGN